MKMPSYTRLQVVRVSSTLPSHKSLAVSLRSYRRKPFLDCMKPSMSLFQPRCLQEACA